MRRITQTSIDRGPLPMAANEQNFITLSIGRQRRCLSVTCGTVRTNRRKRGTK